MALPDFNEQSLELTKLERLNRLSDLMASYVIKNYLLVGKAEQSLIVTYYHPNLYRVAVEHYGDADLWTVIAKANGLKDPKVNVTIPLLIPPKPPTESNGILNP